MSAVASSSKPAARVSSPADAETPSARRSATVAYTSLPLSAARLGRGLVVGQRLGGHGAALAGRHDLEVVRGAPLHLGGVGLGLVEGLGFLLGADVGGQRSVLVARHLVHGLEVVSDGLVDAAPTAFLLELDAGVGVAPQYMATAGIEWLQAYESSLHVVSWITAGR